MISTYSVGEVVSAWFFPGYQHFGIVSERGTVIHASKRQEKVVESSVGEFSEGLPITRHGIDGNLPPYEIVQRARQRIGRPYRLFLQNCEHFVTEVCGVEPRSPQIKGLIFVLLCVLGFSFLPRA
ncbi:hypothetical protein JCM17846_03850 [Iodidimonas nitroreducens]|uniref:LRAT domain-containing protein n=1 Tax=Iodidimonas nitroreducens TaxID=1236968 RepID=A0A5A7N358_9PROT|nr:lecithin retinol acyltransferase family protein [Iodidimonas nitroreducens]GAK32146.1 NC domain protein [alpha proteobacterium Q-1]GER02703.1 hypothetical protein JCM17846_03850 [Iodidimonas nitroreducens]